MGVRLGKKSVSEVLKDRLQGIMNCDQYRHASNTHNDRHINHSFLIFPPTDRIGNLGYRYRKVLPPPPHHNPSGTKQIIVTIMNYSIPT